MKSSRQYWLQAIACIGEKNYLLAVDLCDKALSSNISNYPYDSTAIILTAKGLALALLMRYDEAIATYTEAINYNKQIPEPNAYYGRGLVWLLKSNYIKAIHDINTTIKYIENFGPAYYARATIFLLCGEYVAAEKDYHKSIEIFEYLPINSLFFNGLGNAKYKLKKYEEAISCYNRAIEIDPHYIAAYNNRGNAYYKTNQYERATYDYKKALECDPSKQKSCPWGNDIIHTLLPKFVFDSETYILARKKCKLFKNDLLSDILYLMKFGKENYDGILKFLICKNEHFKTIVDPDIKNMHKYCMLYSYILQILSLLHIDNISYPVAHYTSKAALYALLYESSPLRFSNANGTNDENEGLLVYSFLDIKRDDTSFSNAYISCFVLDADSHNMFRLYGKTDNKENSGFSLSFNQLFFNDRISFDSIYQSSVHEKSSLFRCIYIGNTNKMNSMKVASIGGSNTEPLRSAIQARLDIIQKILVEEKNLDQGIINKLLLPLRYLIKSDSWKDEHECRIIKIIQNLRNSSPNDYINYMPVEDYVTDVFIGSNAFENVDVLEDFIYDFKAKFPHINCQQSKHTNKISK